MGSSKVSNCVKIAFVRDSDKLKIAICVAKRILLIEMRVHPLGTIVSIRRSGDAVVEYTQSRMRMVTGISARKLYHAGMDVSGKCVKEGKMKHWGWTRNLCNGLL